MLSSKLDIYKTVHIDNKRSYDSEKEREKEIEREREREREKERVATDNLVRTWIFTVSGNCLLCCNISVKTRTDKCF